MKRKHAFLQIVILAVSAALMYWSISAEGVYQIAASAIAMVFMVADAVIFASSSRDAFTKILSILISICAILAASAICAGSIIPPAAPAEETPVEEIIAEEEVPAPEETVSEESLPEEEEEVVVEPPRVPSAPSVSVRSQEIAEGEPETISGKGSASVPSAPEVFNLVWIDDEEV